jgi:hypothetical protein
MCKRFINRNLLLQYSDSFDESMERVSQVNQLLAVCVCKGKSTGRSSVSAERVEKIRQYLVRRPHKSVRLSRKEFNVPKTSLWQDLRKGLYLQPYRSQILQQLKSMKKREGYDL